MREIKFRAWDLENGRWLTENEIENRLFLNYSKQEGYFELNELLSNGAAKNLGLNIKLMQFTGLYDRNGREIYEGDIVKTTDGIEESIHEIKYCIDCEYPAFELVPTPDVGCNALQHAICSGDEEIEVIGNIYESPELLEGGGDK